MHLITVVIGNRGYFTAKLLMLSMGTGYRYRGAFTYFNIAICLRQTKKANIFDLD